MKIPFFLLSLIVINVSLLTGCQSTASGFTNDVSRNTADVRREVNEN